MTSNARVRFWPWAAGIAAAVAAASVVWLLRNTWPVQLLFIYIGLFTGIDVQNLWDPPARWHVKQTLTIETPQGDVTSSVVREKVMRKDRLFGTSPTDELGEALVIDLDGDGVELVSLADSRAFFDLDVNGFAEFTAWVKGDDGFLAFDRNGNGRIDDRTELFGALDPAQAQTANGFTELAKLNTNGDGRIDAQDAAFGSLRIWRDLDGDGLTDAGELQTLAQAGITSINLAATYVNQTRGPQPGGAQRGRALRPLPHRRRLDGAHHPRGDARRHADRGGDAGRGWGLAA